MNVYDNAVIGDIRKFPNDDERLHACLYSQDGELLIAATLDYIVEALNARTTKQSENLK